LRLGQPTVSRRLADLEYSIGYPLFRRGVSGASLTAAGERLLAPAKKMAEWAAEVDRTASKTLSAPRGVVRLTAPPGVAYEFIAPFAAWLRGKLPEIHLEVLSTMNYLDLVRGEADLAMRIKAPTDPNLVVVGSVSETVRVYAAKSYAAKLPKHYTMADLDWIAWAPPYDSLPPNPQLSQLIPDFKAAFTSDSFLVQWRAAEAGVGAFITALGSHRFVRNSGLVPLDIDLGPFRQSQMHLVAAKSALEIPRVRAVAELLLEKMKN
jgi:DNA-binding transcriptional LysR family regulator